MDADKKSPIPATAPSTITVTPEAPAHHTSQKPTTPPTPQLPTPGLISRSPAAARELTPAPATPAAAREPTHGPASPAAETTGPLPGSYWAEQGLPKEEENDGDSTIGSDIESSTASISSSILKYRTMNGRTYHSDTGPNDAKQNEMLDIFHYVMTIYLDGRLYNAPLPKNPENTIDLGTGTGLWAIDFADKFPNCNVMGTDISPIQPSWVPPNVRFEIDDYNKEWTYNSNFFDFIHLRWLTGTVKDWSAFYKEAYRCCKPGGYIEHMDASSGTICLDDSSVNTKVHALGQWGPMWEEACGKIGQQLLSNDIVENGMKEAGFVNIVVKDYKKELKDTTLHPYFIYRMVYGQKPLDA
ncbi:S-adenosyl-L-methionine-dependent methyltransferase [Pseudoneurospora amorphoporcata]|uniref:S-adenosyl-L-methionine-dependent methyltransferase n=1 Tax=Pseudoneurospora amorphoporcata TaxID=241081 RepID=A0AAN6SBF0_9PEZI|nr:S-adenosyl-L-methionine-dependent methyltransferase [Pseudoneurospora amorphoporcata]